MKIYGQTDVGRVRNNNQDRFAIEHTENLEIGVVCDGMGGAAGGSTASSIACETFLQSVKDKIDSGVTPEEYESVLIRAVEDANEKVYSVSKSDKELEGMGTTLCAFLTDGKTLWAVSIGDSRIYMFSDGEIHQISHDHSYIQVLIDSGAITKEEIRNHPNKNIITKAVGTQKDVECDSFVMPYSMDGLLLCSDGLTNYVTDSELNELFGQYSKEAEKLVKFYIDKANEGGGGDNITALVCVNDK